MVEELLFEVETPLGFRVRTTREWWQVIVTVKHPAMFGRENDVRAVLERPERVRRSRSDPDVYLFYRLDTPARWVCAIARREDNQLVFLITAYPTDAVKIGDEVWTR